MGILVRHASRMPRLHGLRFVHLASFVHVSGPFAWVVAAGLLLMGCAIFETQTPYPRWGQQDTRVSLKDDGWTQSVVTYAKPKVVRSFRSAGPRPSRTAKTARSANEDGSCDSVDQCALLLRLMVDDPTRSWIRERASPAVYANGTRLFAYLALRKNMTCSELTLALEETRAAANSFKDTIPGVTVDQVTRVRALNTEVTVELLAEQAERCPNDPATPSQ